MTVIANFPSGKKVIEERIPELIAKGLVNMSKTPETIDKVIETIKKDSITI